MQGVIERAIACRDADMNGHETTVTDDGLILCSKEGKYFFFMHEDNEPDMHKIIFSTYMEQIVRGDTSYYTHSEIVVKRGQKDSTSTKTAFGWHQDSGYVPYQHTPYLSCWCALSEMTESNGTISVLPNERNPPEDQDHIVNWSAKPRPLAIKEFPCYQHRKDDKSPDLIGYFGKDPGVEVLCPIGSIVVFSTLTLHCSTPNRSNTLRSAYNVQYAPVPLMSEDGQTFRHKADLFVVDSKTDPQAKMWQQ
ncbi:unnamed protein product [Didymodactylos carnosus]|uniref:Phytanoyl-CoA dioxygenase n=1 Tax=Didymodactylos carnosus TaxID=1234261 RepID=A0A814G8Y0_9BILA|nr:unnamed protein product [Didymodactylos carnosus]CAF0990926.1 unnamed protein product [Didymodactylos carnosus]CAF3613778.1 unnamed protein product [Didymodactylos carnosus]CAF3762954.1 unnamed protein product [Didymodactylos carnosus]